MREPRDYKVLTNAHASAVSSDTPGPSTLSQGGDGGKPPDPPGPNEPATPEPNNPEPNRPAIIKPPIWRGDGDMFSENRAANSWNETINGSYTERRLAETRIDRVDEASEPSIESPSDDPGPPEPPSGQGISEEFFDKTVGEQDRDAAQLPREPNRPDYGDLKREQSQAKSFAERHPPQGPEINR